MYNKIIIAGNLTRDIEIRYTQSGSAIGNTGIATTRKFKAQDGSQKEETLFVDVTFFGRSAELANQYLRKGSKVLLDGRLKLDQWTAQDGSKRSKHSVTVENMQFLDSKSDGGQAGGQGAGQGQHEPQDNGGYGQYADPQGQHAPQATPDNNMDDPNRHNVGGNMNRPPNGGQYPPNGCVTPKPIPDIDINEDEIPF